MKPDKTVSRDKAHAPIVKALKACGWYFKDVAWMSGLGCDLITRKVDGSPLFLEIKNPGAPPSWSKLTPAELELQREFPDNFRVVRTWAEVVAAIGLPAAYAAAV